MDVTGFQMPIPNMYYGKVRISQCLRMALRRVREQVDRNSSLVWPRGTTPFHCLERAPNAVLLTNGSSLPRLKGNTPLVGNGSSYIILATCRHTPQHRSQ